MIFSSFVLWGKVFRNFRRTKKDRRGRNLRLSLHDYHSLPAMIAQTPAPRKSFLPFSPVLRKILHKRPGTSGQLCCDSPGSPPCWEQSFSPKGTIVRTHRTESGILYVPSAIFQELHNFMFLSLCTLRIDKSIRNMYNKARNQRSTAEAQERATPADLKQKGAKTDG